MQPVIWFWIAEKQADRDAVYTIVEAPKDGVTTAENMVIAFPVYEMIQQADGSYVYGEEELDTIHLYPKNIVTNEGTLLVNKRGTGKTNHWMMRNLLFQSKKDAKIPRNTF